MKTDDRRRRGVGALVRSLAGDLRRLLVVPGLLLLAAAAPLTPAQLVRLETARDGIDHREEAFAALVENVSAWSPGGPGSQPVRLTIDPASLLDNPAAHRGELCLVEGVVQQRIALAEPWSGITEWAIRHDDGEPMLVYVAGDDWPAASTRPGRRVRVLARFYKRVELMAQDGTRRAYAAFVGAHPRPLDVGAAGAGQLAVLAIPLALLAIIFAALLVLTRRSRRSQRARPVTASPAPDDLDDEAPLPDDPSAALAELKRRAEQA